MMQFQRGAAYADTAEGWRWTRDLAQSIAETEGTPVGIWARGGWLVVSDVAPDIDETDTRADDGWWLADTFAPPTGDPHGQA